MTEMTLTRAEQPTFTYSGSTEKILTTGAGRWLNQKGWKYIRVGGEDTAQVVAFQIAGCGYDDREALKAAGFRWVPTDLAAKEEGVEVKGVWEYLAHVKTDMTPSQFMREFKRHMENQIPAEYVDSAFELFTADFELD